MGSLNYINQSIQFQKALKRYFECCTEVKGMKKTFWYKKLIFSDLYMHKSNQKCKKVKLSFVTPFDHCAWQ